MKKVFLVLLFLFFLLSCRKSTDAPGPSAANTLKSFRWQKVQPYSFKFPLDTTQVIAYADTSSLVFDEPQFTRGEQYTMVYFVIGSAPPLFRLQKNTVATTGDYSFRSADSTLQLNYTAKTGGNPPWTIPYRDTVVQQSFKVLKLDNEMLALRLLPGPGSIFPPLNLVDTFRAVPR